MTDSLSMLYLRRPWMARVDRATLGADALAGLTNAAIVLPQGMAFAIIAGLSPHYGLFTAIITTAVAAFWGSSSVMVSGPTTAISAVMFTAISTYAVPGTETYIAMALTVTVMVGMIQLAAGLARLGGLIAFISHSVIVGFTAAAAILIGVSQLGGALGVEVAGGGGVFERLSRLISAIGGTKPTAVVIAAVTLLCILAIQRIDKRMPAYIVALAAGAAMGWALDAPARSVAMFSELPAVLPSFLIPDVGPSQIIDLLPAAATIAFVGLLEAISIGRSFAVRRGEKFDANQEIVGQGLSNAIGGLFQCYAGSGSFTRSGLNAESGARTPLAAILAATFLLALLLILAPLVQYIPVPAISGIILYVAWRLINFAEIRHILRSRAETAILAATFLTGILTHLELAIVAGVIASLVLFLYDSAHPFVGVGAPTYVDGHRCFKNADRFNLPQCPQLRMMRMHGPVFFASGDAIEMSLRKMDAERPDQTNLILELKGTEKIDMAGADLLISEILRARDRGGDFRIIATYPGVLRQLVRLGVMQVLGRNHLHPNKTSAIAKAAPTLSEDICRTCGLRVFHECAQRPCGASNDDGPARSV
ncbi:SulP family inorganic anion transporter [Paracoccus homiensis]|uniref:Sulfate permease, SulP family n=1 Tax=Paracoccus homiensis TaxID=364199 RepID=A0A1I0IR42_9RHOB|nr:SulP family inorganic anion transporter [Paracoccus homiensis]SET99570.1 sulfate permease, SulP family [Paracoccus homiensis]